MRHSGPGLGRLTPAITFAALVLTLTGCGSLGRGLHTAALDGAPVLSAGAAAAGEPVTAAPVVDTIQATEARVARFDDSLAWAAPVNDLTTAAVEVMDVFATCRELGVDAEQTSADETSADEISATLPAAVADAPPLLAQAGSQNSAAQDEYDVEDYDPWERFNEKMFEVNLKLDRYILKPAAKVYDKVLPDTVQRMIANAFDNINAIPRFVNSVLQGKWEGALREVGRFLLNTTVGVGGLFDIARHAEIEKSREDFGQTLGFYGVSPGPYLVLPLLPPLTVRDGIGKGVDGFMDPLSYLVPLIPVRLGLKVLETVNDRSLNLELYEGFEETMVDLYSAVRHAYLERRRQLIKE